MSVHNVKPEDTENEQSFDQVWPKIKPYIDKSQLWAHNAKSVEQPILHWHMIRRHLNADFLSILDSMDLYQRPDCEPNSGNGLWQCCLAMGKEFDPKQYHDATYDAKKCAEIVIAYAKGQRPNWTGVPKSNEELFKQQKGTRMLHLGEFADYYAKHKSGEENVSAMLSSTYPNAPVGILEVFSKSDNIKVDKIKKGGNISIDITQLNPDNVKLLQGKNVVVTGLFKYNRKDIENACKAMGAKRVDDNDPNKNTDVIILGAHNSGYKKLIAIDKQEAQGHHIARIVGDDDLKEFLYGDGHKFFQG